MAATITVTDEQIQERIRRYNDMNWDIETGEGKLEGNPEGWATIMLLIEEVAGLAQRMEPAHYSDEAVCYGIDGGIELANMFRD